MGIISDIEIISKVVPRKRDGYQAVQTTTVIQGGGGTGGSSENAEHANSAYTLDNDTPVKNWFLSATGDDEANGVINFLKGIKIAGKAIARLVGKDDEVEEYAEGDLMDALRVMKEIENSTEKLKDVFLRKDIDDSTKFLLTMFAGAVFGKNGFATGLTGFGAKIFDTGHGEFESMFIRRFLEVPLLVYNRVDIKLGDKWRAPGAGITKTVDTVNKLVTLKLEDGEIGAVAVGDICMGIYHSYNQSDNATEDSDDSKGNRKFSGFCTVYFTITEVIGDRNEQFKYQVRPVSSSWPHSFEPFEMMTFVAYGNFTNTERQTSVYETRTYTRMLWKQNTWEISAANIALQYGELDNLNVHGMNMQGYSMYLNNVYFTGTINQVKPDGTPIKVVNFVGRWTAGDFDYYDSVTHNGSTWVCINEDGTTEEPGTGNDWLLTSAKGDDGAGVSNLGNWKSGMNVPYLGIVRMGTASYQCINEDGTTNPPLWCYTDDSGNRFTYNDGGYVLTGEANDTDYKLIAEDGTDGKDGKDGVAVNNVDVVYAISDSGTVAPTTGWQTTAPAWENGKYIWSKTLVDYGDGTSSETPAVCISGGKGIKTITEYYYRSSSETTQTGGSWQTTYPGWQNGTYIWTKSIITYTDGTTEETPPACVTGSKGEGYTQMGQWKSTMTVPKMGVVSMGGGSYVAKVATTNPPLWCYKDNSGNYLTYNDGGYVLTGEVNTAEYDVWAEKGDKGETGEKGDKGDKGEDGAKGEQGIQGCIIRDSEWATGVEYRNDEALTGGTRYIDVALVKSSTTATGWDAYKCKKTHTSSSSITYTNTTYWEKFGTNTTAIFTSLIIAKNAKLTFTQSNQLLIQTDAGEITAGLSGATTGNQIRIWAGASTPDNAPFKVDYLGQLVATKANISGVVTASLLYQPAKQVNLLSGIRLNPATHGTFFYAQNGWGGTVNLPNPSNWEGLKLTFVSDLLSRVAVGPTVLSNYTGYYFRGLVSGVNQKQAISVQRPYVVEMVAINSGWFITRLDADSWE